VRDFAAAVQAQPVRGGVLLTNTMFSPDAKWFAEETKHFVQLRDFNDLTRLIRDLGDRHGTIA